MRCKVLAALPVILLSTSQLSSVKAQPASRTSLSYYAVTGDTLADLRRDMMRKGPRSEGGIGYGMTTVRPGKKMSVAACKSIGRYAFDAEFVIILPRLATDAKLSAAERQQFSGFVGFVKRHEETHRSIWMKYIARAERDFRAAATADCAQAHTRAMRLWQAMMANCRQIHTAFDKQQRGPLRSHPFIKTAKR